MLLLITIVMCRPRCISCRSRDRGAAVNALLAAGANIDAVRCGLCVCVYASVLVLARETVHVCMYRMSNVRNAHNRLI